MLRLESRVLYIFILNVIMLSVVILNIMAQGINTLAYFGEASVMKKKVL